MALDRDLAALRERVRQLESRIAVPGGDEGEVLIRRKSRRQGAAWEAGAQLLLATATADLTLTTSAQSIPGDGDASKVRLLLPTPGDWLIEATCDFDHAVAGAGVAIGDLHVNDSASPQGSQVLLQQDATRATVGQRWQVTTTSANVPVELKARKTAAGGTALSHGGHTRLSASIGIGGGSASAVGNHGSASHSAESDAQAIHDNVAGEIAALTEKVTPVSGDHLLIEDSAATNAKKRVYVGNLPGGGGGGHTIQEDGSPLTARSNLNIRRGLKATDGGAGPDSTIIDLLTFEFGFDAIVDGVGGSTSFYATLADAVNAGVNILVVSNQSAEADVTIDAADPVVLIAQLTPLSGAKLPSILCNKAGVRFEKALIPAGERIIIGNVADATDCVVSGCRFEKSGNSAAYIGSGSGGNRASRLIIDDCEFVETSPGSALWTTQKGLIEVEGDSVTIRAKFRAISFVRRLVAAKAQTVDNWVLDIIALGCYTWEPLIADDDPNNLAANNLMTGWCVNVIASVLENGAVLLSGSAASVRAQLDGVTKRTWDSVQTYDGVAYTDRTAEANSKGGTPFTLLVDANDYLYIGSSQPFWWLRWDLNVAQVGGSNAFEYSQGAGAWAALSTSGNILEVLRGRALWIPPSDWATDTVNAVAAKYWIRVSAPVAPSTPATCNWLRTPQIGVAKSWARGLAVDGSISNCQTAVAVVGGSVAAYGLSFKGTVVYCSLAFDYIGGVTALIGPIMLVNAAGANVCDVDLAGNQYCTMIGRTMTAAGSALLNPPTDYAGTIEFVAAPGTLVGFTGSLVPQTDELFDIGSATTQLRSLYASEVLHEEAALSLANGANNDIALPANSSWVRVTGPTGAFSVSGFASPVNGKLLVLYNSTAETMTIVNDATSTVANRIYTLTGADVTLTGQSSATFRYSTADSRWILVATSG